MLRNQIKNFAQSSLFLLTRHSSIPKSLDGACIPFNKPLGIRSQLLLDKIKHGCKHMRVRKLGHCGTLDNNATGVLLCLFGKATKFSNIAINSGKTYEATMKLGEETPSYDADTTPTVIKDWQHVKDADIQAIIREKFVGNIEQKVPLYSAVHFDGKRLHEYVYKGEPDQILNKEQLPVRTVNISEFQVLERDGQFVKIRVACSKGTYIRCIAHDLGQELGVGAHIVQLSRTAIGDITLDDSWELEEFLDAIKHKPIVA